MDTSLTRARRLAEVARPQGSCYTREQALAAGYTQSAIDRRVRDGEISVVIPRVYVPSSVPVDHALRVRALRLYVTDGVISHASAARLWEMPGYANNEELHVISSSPYPVRLPGVVVHRHELQDFEITDLGGHPITSPDRTIRDLAAHHWPKWLTILATDACRRGLTTPEELERRIVSGARGAARMRVVVEQLRSQPLGRSHREGQFQALFRGHPELPPPICNAVRTLRDGRVTEFDTLWEPELVVNEYDGSAFHTLGPDRRRDEARDASARASGFDIRRWGDEAFDNPDRVVADTVARLQTARARLSLPQR
jgi:hypothetical protein